MGLQVARVPVAARARTDFGVGVGGRSRRAQSQGKRQRGAKQVIKGKRKKKSNDTTGQPQRARVLGGQMEEHQGTQWRGLRFGLVLGKASTHRLSRALIKSDSRSWLIKLN